jgi:hypothetical protein
MDGFIMRVFLWPKALTPANYPPGSRYTLADPSSKPTGMLKHGQ